MKTNTEQFTGHMPGPWEAHDWRVTCRDAFGWTHVVCDTAHNKATRTLAAKCNATIIAAAPTLLSQRNRLVEALDALLDVAQGELPCNPKTLSAVSGAQRIIAEVRGDK